MPVSKISHRKAQQWIHRQADQLLNKRQERALAAHLGECAGCCAYQTEMEKLNSSISGALQARVERLTHQAPAFPIAQQPERVYQQIRRNIRMKKIQQTSLGILGFLVIIGIVIGGISLGQKIAALPTATPAPAIQPTDLTGTEEDVTITFAAEPAARSVYEALMEDFHQQYPNISVQYVEADPSLQLPVSDQVTRADTMLAVSRNQIIKGAGYYLDLTPLMESDADFQANDFWPNALSGCRDAEQRSYGIPLSLYFLGILYDPQTLDESGIPYPQPGWTWEDFRRIVGALPSGSSLSGQYPFVDQPVYRDEQITAINSLVAPILDAVLAENNGLIEPDSLIQSVQWYLDLVQQKRIFPIAENWQSETYTQLFADGYPAMYIGATNSWLEDRLALEVYNMLPFPVDAGETKIPTSPITASCGVISAGSKHPQESWLWLNFLSQNWIHGDERLFYINQAIPARPSVANGTPFWDQIHPGAVDSIRYSLEHGWYGSPYPAALWAVSAALIDTASNGADFRSALEQARAAMASLPESDSQKTPVAVATPRPVTGDAVTIRFFTGEVFENMQKFKDMAAEFTRQNPEIQVELSSPMNPVDFPSGGDDLFTFPAENYDCFEVELHDLPNRDLTLLYDINAWLDQDTTLRADIDPGQLEAYSVDGRVYGLPAAIRPNLMFYNKNLLERLGIPAPESDWTFDDFIRLATMASTTLDGQKVYGFAPYAHRDVGLLLAGQGIEWLDVSGSFPTAHLDTQTALGAYRWMEGLVQSGVLLPVTSKDSSQAIQDALYGGRLAFWTAESQPWGGWYLNLPDLVDFEIGGTPLPQTQMLNTADNPGMTGLFISKKTQHPQACWDWIHYLSGQPAAFPGVPARRSVAGSAAWETLVGPEKAAVYRAAMEQSRSAMKPSAQENHVLNTMFWISSMVLGDILDGMDAGIALSAGQEKTGLLNQCLESSQVLNLPSGDRQEVILGCLERMDAGN